MDVIKVRGYDLNNRNIINLTPHDVHVMMKDGTTVTIPSSGVARCSETEHLVGCVNGIPVLEKHFGAVEGMLPIDGDTIYIVSMLVARNLVLQDNVVFPNDVVRDSKGAIVGCRSFARYQ